MEKFGYEVVDAESQGSWRGSVKKVKISRGCDVTGRWSEGDGDVGS
jgi:hypothetical protein